MSSRYQLETALNGLTGPAPAGDRSGSDPAGTDRVGADLVCVSYLAEATILTVRQYPPANRGALVHDTSDSIAADGPIVALTGARLGLATRLIANHLGADAAGRRLVETLNDHRVGHDIHLKTGYRTPHLTVIADEADTRTWFAQLDTVSNDLTAAVTTALTDTGPGKVPGSGPGNVPGEGSGILRSARMAYIDCYTALDAPAAQMISNAGSTPLLLNLGGDRLSPAIVRAAAGQHIAAVQTNLDETHAGHADTLAAHLLDQVDAQAAVITLGSRGALVRTPRGSTHVPAPDILPGAVRNTHGAGAAFSAGYAHALLNGHGPVAATRAGCDLGTAHCTTRSHTGSNPGSQARSKAGTPEGASR